METKDKRIVINKHELTEKIPKHRSILFTPVFQSIAICGQSGSGKSYSLLLLTKALQKPCVLFIIGPNLKEQSVYKKIIEHFKAKGSKIIIIEDISEIPNKITYEKLRDTHSATVIIDDLDAKQLAHENIVSLFRKGRHMGLNLLLCHQSYTEVPITIRRNLTGIAIFPSSSGFDIIFKDLKNYFSDKKEFMEWVKSTVYSGNKGDFMYVSLEAGIKPFLRRRKNFYQVNLDDPDVAQVSKK